MNVFIDPLVIRGIPLDEQTQSGFAGTADQVLMQQGRISGGVLSDHLNNFLRDIARKHGEKCLCLHKTCLPIRSCSCCQDAKICEDGKVTHQEHEEADK